MRNRALPADTSVEAARVHFAVWQRFGVDRRIGAAIQLNAEVRRACEAAIQRRHPEYSSTQVRLAALRLRIGEELFHKACPGQNVLP